MSKVPVIDVHLPEYQVTTKSDYKAPGEIVDAELKKTLHGPNGGLRALGSES